MNWPLHACAPLTGEALCPGSSMARDPLAEERDYCVIVPCFNGSATLERALVSALTQSVPPAEIIVVDDGSSDVAATEAIVARYPGRVRLVRQSNGGPAAARNAGVRLASSTWLAFLDADDTWREQKMDRQFDLVKSAQIGLIHDSGEKRGAISPAAPTFDDLWRHNWVRTSSAVVRRQAFLSVGGFDEDRDLVGAEDYNLWLRISAAGWEFAAHDELLFDYTPAADSITSQVERCARGELWNIRKLQTSLNLDHRRVEQKLLQIQLAFARDLLHCRSMPAARAMLVAPVRHLKIEALLLWLISMVPVPLLDLRRRWRPR
jgi:glycosyltransferase involved in cell wall biosynthesis